MVTLRIVLLCISIAMSCNAFAAECNIPESERVDHGYPGIIALHCQALGGCWDDRTRGIPDCYKPADRMYECVVKPEDRRDAGYAGITQQDCIVNRRGCWGDTIRNNPDGSITSLLTKKLDQGDI